MIPSVAAGKVKQKNKKKTSLIRVDQTAYGAREKLSICCTGRDIFVTLAIIRNSLRK